MLFIINPQRPLDIVNDSMLFLLEDLLLATGSTNKSLKLWKKKGSQSIALITMCKDIQVALHVYWLFFSDKAVADGAISYYIDHFVQTRVSKLTYGSRVRIRYDRSNPEHRKRPTTTIGSGGKRIDDVFWVMLPGVSYLLVSTLKKKNIENINLFYT